MAIPPSAILGCMGSLLVCVALVWHVCSTDIDECLEFDSGSGSGSGGDSDASLSGSGSDGIGLSGSGRSDSQEVCPPDQFCVNTFGSFLCLCLPGFTSVGDACLGKSVYYATDVQTTIYLIPSTQCIVFLSLNLATCIHPLFLP